MSSSHTRFEQLDFSVARFIRLGGWWSQLGVSDAFFGVSRLDEFQAGLTEPQLGWTVS